MAGASPNFSDIHLIRALIALEERTGRKTLLQEIGIGEGSMRTVLKKLKSDGLIDSTRAGHKITDAGRRYLENYLENFTAPFRIKAGDIVPGEKAGIVVHGASEEITSGLSERDEAVRQGASGAIILEYDYKFKKLKFPGNIQKIEDFPEFKSEIESMDIKFKKGDVLVVAFCDDYAACENAAVAVALNLAG